MYDKHKKVASVKYGSEDHFECIFLNLDILSKSSSFHRRGLT